MKCQSLFSGKNKKNIISLSSAELAHGVGKVYITGIKVGKNYNLILICSKNTKILQQIYSLSIQKSCKIM